MLGRADIDDTGGGGYAGNNPVPVGIDPFDRSIFEGKVYSLKNRDFLISQIQKINVLAKNTTFDTAPVPATFLYMDVATRLAAFDIQDVRELSMGLFNGTTLLSISQPGSVPQYFNKRTGKILEGIGGDPGKKLFASTVGGGGTLSYYTQFTDSGIPVFAVIKGDSGFWEDVKKGAGIIGLILAFTGVGAIIGAAVMGAAAAAAYPLVAAAIGNICIETVLTGGDISAAVKNGVLGMAAQGIGGYVGGATQSAVIGQAAQAATNAAIKGQSIDVAVASAVIVNYGQQGIKMLNDSVTDSLDPDASDFSDPNFFNFDLDTDFLAALNQLDLSPMTIVPDSWGNLFTVTGDYLQLSPNTYAQWLYTDSDGNIRDATNNVVLTAAEAEFAISQNQAMGADMAVKMAVWDQMINRAPGFENPVPANDATPADMPKAAPQIKLPTANGMTWAEFASNAFKATMQYETARMQLMRTGRIVPTYATGTGTPYSQVVGLPVVQADGSIITRNANGTQTIQYPDGSTQIIGGVAQSTGINTNTLLIGGAVLAGLLILKG